MNRTDVFIGLSMVAAVVGLVLSAALRSRFIVGVAAWGNVLMRHAPPFSLWGFWG